MMIKLQSGELKPQHIQDALKKHNLTIAKLSKLSGVNRQSISKWIHGHAVKRSLKEFMMIRTINRLNANIPIKDLPIGRV